MIGNILFSLAVMVVLPLAMFAGFLCLYLVLLGAL
jgi:hypothetical protein